MEKMDEVDEAEEEEKETPFAKDKGHGKQNERKKMRCTFCGRIAREQHRIIYERLRSIFAFSVCSQVLRNLLLIYVNHLNIVYPLKDTTRAQQHRHRDCWLAAARYCFEPPFSTFTVIAVDIFGRLH